MIIFETLYLLSLILLAIYGLNSILLVWVYKSRIKSGFDQTQQQVDSDLVAQAALPLQLSAYPPVTIQLPIYNERHVTERLIDAVMKLDWPAEKLQIQVLDDSTDDTRFIIAATITRHQAAGSTIELAHIRRPNRIGYKAGALQHGLASASGEFVAIFDADFIPPANFLTKTIPFFGDATVGCVQTRWGHVNPDSSHLTQAQALGIDGHFVIEQHARHKIRAFLNFNGTAGVWRQSCMLDAGGWQGDTLTEDLDLSYRAQFKQWRIVYQPQMTVPAELPVQIDAFKRQQFRWAKGSMQTAIKLMGRLWQLQRPLWLKFLASLHLTNYSVHPLMLANLLLILPMTLSRSPVLYYSPLLTLSAIGPPLLYWTVLQEKQLSLWVRLSRLLMLIALGTGLSVNNSKAVFEAVFGLNSEFKRTPKFAVTGQSTTWQQSSYTLPRDPSAWIELLLSLYAWGLMAWSFASGLWWLTPWLLLYGAGYSYIAALTFIQAWQTKAARATGTAGLELP